MVDRCTDCGTSLGTQTQETMFGVPKRCYDCEEKARVKMMLTCLPDPGDREWDALSEWEQTFLTSLRRQHAQKALSEKQIEVLERVWAKR